MLRAFCRATKTYEYRTRRGYATVSSTLVNPNIPPPPPPRIPSFTELLDQTILSATSDCTTSLSTLAYHYSENSGRVVNVSLPYESRPSVGRKPDSSASSDVVMVAHSIRGEGSHKVTVASGFALEAPSNHSGDSLIITCAHTFEEIRRSPLMMKADNNGGVSGTIVISGTENIATHPVSAIVSSLPRSDLMLLSCARAPVRTLPVSPYPAQPQTPIRAHFVAHERPDEPGWTPWVGGTWSKWVRGTVLGYRDFAGRETMPGTYDALSHLLFEPLPTAGSSGGPIIEEESGAVIGVMLGTRMDNRVEGMRGWGVPSETIYEMFSLPGLEGKHIT